MFQYFNSTDITPQAFISQLPMEDLKEALKFNDQQISLDLGTGSMLEQQLNSLNVENEQDKEALANTVGVHKDHINSVLDKVNKDPNNWRRYRKDMQNASRELMDDFREGDLGKILTENQRMSTYLKSVADAKGLSDNDKKLFTSLAKTGYKGFQSGFNGINFTDTPDLYATLQPILKEIKESGAITGIETENDLVHALQDKSWMGVLPKTVVDTIISTLQSKPEILNSLMQREDLNFPGYSGITRVDENGNRSLNFYSEVDAFDDKGNPTKKTVLSDNMLGHTLNSLTNVYSRMKTKDNVSNRMGAVEQARLVNDNKHKYWELEQALTANIKAGEQDAKAIEDFVASGLNNAAKNFDPYNAEKITYDQHMAEASKKIQRDLPTFMEWRKKNYGVPMDGISASMQIVGSDKKDLGSVVAGLAPTAPKIGASYDIISTGQVSMEPMFDKSGDLVLPNSTSNKESQKMQSGTNFLSHYSQVESDFNKADAQLRAATKNGTVTQEMLNARNNAYNTKTALDAYYNEASMEAYLGLNAHEKAMFGNSLGDLRGRKQRLQQEYENTLKTTNNSGTSSDRSYTRELELKVAQNSLTSIGKDLQQIDKIEKKYLAGLGAAAERKQHTTVVNTTNAPVDLTPYTASIQASLSTDPTKIKVNAVDKALSGKDLRVLVGGKFYSMNPSSSSSVFSAMSRGEVKFEDVFEPTSGHLTGGVHTPNNVMMVRTKGALTDENYTDMQNNPKGKNSAYVTIDAGPDAWRTIANKEGQRGNKGAAELNNIYSNRDRATFIVDVNKLNIHPSPNTKPGMADPTSAVDYFTTVNVDGNRVTKKLRIIPVNLESGTGYKVQEVTRDNRVINLMNGNVFKSVQDISLSLQF